MPSINGLLASAQALQDDLALLRALEELGAGWTAAAGSVQDLPSLETLFVLMAQDLEADATKAAFASFGGEPVRAKIASLVARSADAGRKLPEPYRRLLTSLAAFKADGAAADRGLVDWALLDRDKPLTIGGGDYALSLAAAAHLQFEAGDVWPFAGDAMPAPLLRITAQAEIGAKGKAKAPFRLGAVEAEAATRAQAKLGWYFDAGGDEAPYAVAVARRLAELPDPWDFDSVWTAFQDGDLAGLVYGFDGSAGLSVQVSLADTLSLAKGVNAQLGASITVGVQMAGGFTLSLRRDAEADGRVLATLSRQSSSRVAGGLGVGVDVDLSALAPRVQQILQAAMAVWQDKLATVRPFLSPGTWLKANAPGVLTQAADALVADPALRAALLQDLRGAAGLDTTDHSAVAAWLEAELAGLVERSGVLTQPSGQADRIADALVSRLPALAQAQFRPQITAVAQGLAGVIEPAFAAAAASLIAGVGVPQVGDLLKTLGESSEALFTTADETLAGVRALIARYDALFRKILEETADATRYKVAARIQFEELRLREGEYAVAGALTSDGPGARAAFHALTRGELDDLSPLLDGAASSGFEFAPERSSFRRFSKSDSKVAFEAVLLGFGLKGAELLSAEADATSDGAGNVRVEARSVLEREFTGLRESREVRLVDVYSVRQVKAQEAADATSRKSLELGLSITHKDQSLKRGEVVGFIGSLEAARLVPAGATDRGRAVFEQWKVTGDNEGLVADLAAKLWLTDEAPLALMQPQGREDGELKREARRAVIRAALTGLEASGALSREKLLALINLVGPLLKTSRQPRTASEVFLDFRDQLKHARYDEVRGLQLDAVSVGNNDFDRNEALADQFVEHYRRIEDLVRFVALLGDVYEAEPADPARPGSPGWDEDDYRRAQGDIAACGRRWLKLNAKLFWLDRDVHPLTVALLVALANLSGVADRAPMTLTITRRSPSGRPETVALA